MLRVIQRTTRKGHIAFETEGPFPSDGRGTQRTYEIGDRLCNEVGLCMLGLPFREREIVEYSVMGIVLGEPTKVMRHAAKVLRISMRHCWRVRKVAFERLAMACERKGIMTW